VTQSVNRMWGCIATHSRLSLTGWHGQYGVERPLNRTLAAHPQHSPPDGRRPNGQNRPTATECETQPPRRPSGRTWLSQHDSPQHHAADRTRTLQQPRRHHTDGPHSPLHTHLADVSTECDRPFGCANRFAGRMGHSQPPNSSVNRRLPVGGAGQRGDQLR